MTARILTPAEERGSMIHVGDCLSILPTLPAESFDSIVTDPPYHLTTGKKGGTGPASVNLESPYGRARIGTGFMGMTWDGGDVAMRPETWAAALRVAKPGAFLAAFGGTRTFHRMMVAIEDAGWEIRDTLMWVYGSGFPKSHNGEWGGTALKPAWEPIILARKPLIGTVEANWRRYGTGALNIDGCRVGATDGRWPANLAHDGSDEVLAAFPDAPGQLANANANAIKTSNTYGSMRRGGGRADLENNGVVGFGMKPGDRRVDAGRAARFFYCAKAGRDDRNEGCDGGAPAPAANNHPTVKPTELMRWLCRLVTPAGGHVLDPFTGSGSTGRGAIAEGLQFTGIELSPDYAAIAEARIRAMQPGLALGAA